MKYMLQFNGSEDDCDVRAHSEKAPAFWAAFMAYVLAVKESGIVLDGAGLQSPHTATIVRLRDGKRKARDGGV
jgi:hypothetical protein